MLNRSRSKYASRPVKKRLNAMRSVLRVSVATIVVLAVRCDVNVMNSVVRVMVSRMKSAALHRLREIRNVAKAVLSVISLAQSVPNVTNPPVQSVTNAAIGANASLRKGENRVRLVSHVRHW